VVLYSMVAIEGRGGDSDEDRGGDGGGDSDKDRGGTGAGTATRTGAATATGRSLVSWYLLPGSTPLSGMKSDN